MPDDQYSEWRRALKGKVLDCGSIGNPTSGFFMRMTPLGREAIAIWRDTEGIIRCFRSIYRAEETMDANDIDELLASCSRYPIPERIFRAVAFENNPWPPEYETRLTNKEEQAGVPWTPELGRQKNEVEIQRMEEPRWQTKFPQ